MNLHAQHRVVYYVTHGLPHTLKSARLLVPGPLLFVNVSSSHTPISGKPNAVLLHTCGWRQISEERAIYVAYHQALTGVCLPTSNGCRRPVGQYCRCRSVQHARYGLMRHAYSERGQRPDTFVLQEFKVALQFLNLLCVAADASAG